MANRLLDRQASLLEYLASAATIFGDQVSPPLNMSLQGIDPGVLRLQARFTCNKRLEKIIAVFPRTLEILGAEQNLTLRDFVAVNPPTNKSTLANAREFHKFLSARWLCEAPNPTYLADVAACELAMDGALNVVDTHEFPPNKRKGDQPQPSIRRGRSVVPLRCSYDIDPFSLQVRGTLSLPKRNISLVITLPAGLQDVSLVEVAPVVVDALMRLDNWTDPSMLDGFGQLDDLISHLAMCGYIDVRI